MRFDIVVKVKDGKPSATAYLDDKAAAAEAFEKDAESGECAYFFRRAPWTKRTTSAKAELAKKTAARKASKKAAKK